MSDGDIKTQYPILIGKLLWVATTVQPDLSFTINTLTWHMSKLTESVMQAALWVMKYLNQTCNEVLWLGGKGKDKLVIAAYTDTNWASDPNTNWQSTSGSVVQVFGSLVTWNSHVQKYNTGCIQIAKDQALHSKLKHIDMKYHLIRHHVLEGNIVMQYIQTDDNITDYLTKLVSQQLLKCTRQHLGMANLDSSHHSVCEEESKNA
ncbi:hypothetical protein NDA10_006772 [Ustilago hordei]|uniref:Reverse transcriptase Ty1/copia-type domain-containing protein n=1 Tax=Ustilago hordei TaxID=120017 RepID=I2FZ31_USTHO|nr:uncharacterized protein UHO2_06788 [Ustilago hordei]KAJ1036874.1 hypothetical protein NDA10_006772 [Ustilago hordei]CCF52174.1 uncharacterized protein UHOR_08458 [Ustilago hordei]SYW83574.1 uncharacterized protein UHO2_06788 [Ustilago hordei]